LLSIAAPIAMPAANPITPAAIASSSSSSSCTTTVVVAGCV
jgi:hypothetical protein